jgi:hypothetical protein
MEKKWEKYSFSADFLQGGVPPNVRDCGEAKIMESWDREGGGAGSNGR